MQGEYITKHTNGKCCGIHKFTMPKEDILEHTNASVSVVYTLANF